MISVAMAVFNGLRFLPVQVDSILSQLRPEDELVIADNGSTDGSWTWLEALAALDSRVRLFQNTKTHGVAANFGFALAQCRGDIIFLSDQDDYWYPQKIETITTAFLTSDRVLLVQSDADLINDVGQCIAPSFYVLRHSRPGFWKNFFRNTYQGCSLAIRRELLELALPIPADVPMHDMWLGLLAELAGSVRFIPDCLTSYRRHDGNLSGLAPQQAWQVILWRLNLAKVLLSAILFRRPRFWLFHGLTRRIRQ